MNNKPFVRKIIYIFMIGVLIIPLSFISAPETRNSEGDIARPGGKLAQLRETHSLSQAKMSDIDPASETMKLASLGLRGVAVNVLWMQAAKHRKDENYDKLSSTLKLLTKIQPNFIRVWEYQAHNLSYNISMEFDDYEQRYSWVKKGLVFLKGGIPHNKRDHRMTDNMGFFTGNKFGKSDEKKSFRRLFRTDEDFHSEMDEMIDSDLYDSRYGYDSWRMAYLWYDFSRKLVEEKNCDQYRSDVMFYQFRPSQLRHQAISLQEEFPPSTFIQSIWRDADQAWIEYGNTPLINTLGIQVTLEGQVATQERLAAARAELDALAEPGRRISMLSDFAKDLGIDEEDQMLIKAEPDQLTEEENVRAQNIRLRLASMDLRLDDKIAMQVAQDQRAEATAVVQKINKIQAELQTIGRDGETVNYPYWRSRNKNEALDSTLVAHQALYEAESVWRKSTYDDEYEFDYKTKEKKITRKGAITLFLEAFELWKPIFENNPRLADGQLSDRMIGSVKEFQKMLRFSNRPWPENFPLQGLIDTRFNKGELDGLPTTVYLNQLKGIEEEDTDTSDEIGAKKPTPEIGSDEKPEAASGDAGEKTSAGESDDEKEAAKAEDDEKEDK